jgi:hypothetical protein
VLLKVAYPLEASQLRQIRIVINCHKESSQLRRIIDPDWLLV